MDAAAAVTEKLRNDADVRCERTLACPAAKHPASVAVAVVVAVLSSRFSTAVIVQPITVTCRWYQTPVATVTGCEASPVQL